MWNFFKIKIVLIRFFLNVLLFINVVFIDEFLCFVFSYIFCIIYILIIFILLNFLNENGR